MTFKDMPGATYAQHKGASPYILRIDEAKTPCRERVSELEKKVYQAGGSLLCDTGDGGTQIYVAYLNNAAQSPSPCLFSAYDSPKEPQTKTSNGQARIVVDLEGLFNPLTRDRYGALLDSFVSFYDTSTVVPRAASLPQEYANLPDLLIAKDIAPLIHKSVKSVYRLINVGEIKGCKIGGSVRVTKEQFIAYMMRVMGNP